MLLHLVDLSNADGGIGDIAADLSTVETELRAFNEELLGRPRLIVGSKMDSAVPERREELRRDAESRGLPYLEISSATHDGIPDLVAELSRKLQAARAEERPEGRENP